MLYYCQQQRVRLAIFAACIALAVITFCAAFWDSGNSFRLLKNGNQEARLSRVIVKDAMRTTVCENEDLLRYLEQCIRRCKTKGFRGTHFVGSTQELVFVGVREDEFNTCGTVYENGMIVYWPDAQGPSSWEGYGIEDGNLWIPFLDPRPAELDELLEEAFSARHLPR